MKTDREILRELAAKYFEIANCDKIKENILMHKKVNDLKQPRPIVLIEEICWKEMNIDHELDLFCQDEKNRKIEEHFRRILFKWKHIPCDMVLPPYYGVTKIVRNTGNGMSRLKENEHDPDVEQAKCFKFVDQLEEEEDLLKLHKMTLTYDEKATVAEFLRVAELFGDILPVKIVGIDIGYQNSCKTFDDLANLRGLDNILYDFIDRPEFIHKTVRVFTDIYLDMIRQYNELGVVNCDSYSLHATAALTNDLHPDFTKPNTSQCWGRGIAQILSTVSPEMLGEFDIPYMIEAMKPFGLVYYGCCEPLDKKVDVVEKIPNLRKISMTPWADIDNGCEVIGNRYVVANKPNPASVALPHLDEDSVKAELNRIVSAIRRNNCSADIVLKDISTVGNNPYNLIKWHDIAMNVVNNY